MIEAREKGQGSQFFLFVITLNEPIPTDHTTIIKGKESPGQSH